MIDDDFDQLYEDLTNELKRHKGSWIVEHVESQIKEGKFISTKKPTYIEKRDQKQTLLYDDHRGYFKKSGKSKFTIIEDYTPKEKVIILIDAIERAICDTQDMVASITRFSTERNIDMQFYNESDGIDFHIEKPTADISAEVRKKIEICKKRIK